MVSYLFFVSITMSLALPVAAINTIKCPDGTTRLPIDVSQISMKYQAPSFSADFISKLGVHLSIDPKQIQQATEATQRWNMFLTGLALGYNSCAISSEQYAEGLQRIYPALKQDATALTELSRRASKGDKVDPHQVEIIVDRFLKGMHTFAELSGQLFASNEPDPVGVVGDVCPLPPREAIKVFFGNSVMWTLGEEGTLLAYVDEPLLSFNKIGEAVVFSAKVFSKDGRIVATVENNFFRVNPNNYFYIERPDASTLVVYDQTARRVLYLKYVNRSTFSVQGEFWLPNHKAVVIGKNGLSYDRRVYWDSCLSNQPVGFVVR